MLEQPDVRFKKCRRCGMYFVVKGNYGTEYCDRVLDRETRTCQQFAAHERYREKINGNAAWKAYNQYYKRYFARAKVGTIKQAVFKQWQYEAVAKRDACADGNLGLGEYLAWLEGSFPNREKKKQG